MIDCDTYLARYSDYLDHDMTVAERDEMEAHADECPHCAHYDRVVRRGTDVLRDLPELEVSEDFADRLRWRLYAADEEERRGRRLATPSQAAGTLVIAAVLAVAAWVPLMRPRPHVGQLPAVAASAPREGTILRRLTAGPLHQEATSLTSRLAQIGVSVREMPYHDVVFRTQGPLVGQLAVFSPQAAAAQQP
ncbi:MAG TPA: zf-HC2 domain-containing protein [Longimicrobium sp.]